MNILYRKIYCKDRMPNELMYYNTDMGYLAWINGGFKNNTNDIANVSVCWWFEKLPIPTDEEIEMMAEKWCKSKGLKNAGFLVSDRFEYRKLSKTWTDSFKAALELLTGGKS